MKKVRTICVLTTLAVVTGLVLAVTTKASIVSRPFIFMSVTDTENVIYDSQWAEDKNVYDVACDGVGRPRINAFGEPTFKQFSCDFTQVTSEYGGPTVCNWNARVLLLTPAKFLVANVNHYTCGDN